MNQAPIETLLRAEALSERRTPSDELAALRTRKRLEQTLATRPQVAVAPTTRLTWRGGAMLTVAIAAVAMLAFFPRAQDQSHFEVAVAGQAARPGQWNEVVENVQLTFHDTLHVRLERGARGRVTQRPDGNVELRLEHGAVSSRGLIARAEPWHVKAGPYSLTTWSDQMDVRWSPEREQLAVLLHAGHAQVVGPKAEAGIKVPVGAWFYIDAREDQSPAPEVVVPEPAAPSETAQALPNALPAATAPTAPAVQARVSSCDVEAVGDASSLLESAQTCRQLHESAGAATLLRRIRLEHAGTAEATRAALELGRLESGTRATRWLETYLAEAGPDDSLRREAIGILLTTTRDPQRSAELARIYLAQHPLGPEAVRAHAILDGN